MNLHNISHTVKRYLLLLVAVPSFSWGEVNSPEDQYHQAPQTVSDPIVLRFSTVEHPSVPIIKMVLQEAYSRIGNYKLEMQVLPPKRSLQQANRGINFDGELARIAADEDRYRNLIRIKIPSARLTPVIISNKPMHEATLDSLNNVRMGLVLGRILDEQMANKFETVTRSKDTVTLLRLLVAGRIDFAILDNHEANSLLKRHEFSELFINPQPRFSKDLYHYLHIRHQTLAEPLKKALRKVEQEGGIKF